MTTKKILVLIAAIATLAGTAEAKKTQSYNLQRAIESTEYYDISGAMEYLERELEDHPKNGEALVWAAYCQVEEEKWLEASKYVQLAIKNLPKSDKSHLEWAHRLNCSINLALGDTAIAMEEIRIAIKTSPSPRNLSRRAGILKDLKLYDAAIADYREALRLDPSYTDANEHIAEIFIGQEKFNEAIKELNIVLKNEDYNPDAYALRGKCNLKLGKISEGVDDIIQALEQSFFLYDIYESFADLDEDAYESLVIRMEAKITADPSSAEWCNNLANLHREQKQYAAAVAAFKQSKSARPSDWIDFEIARTYAEQEDFEHALKYINLAIEGDTTYQHYWKVRGIINHSLGDFEASLSDFSSCLEDDPENGFLHHNIGQCQFFLNQFDEAAKSFTAAYTFDPTDISSLYWKGLVLQKKGDTTKAEKTLRKVIESDTTLFHDAALSHARLGEREKALVADKQRLEKDSSDSRFYNTACMYSILGDTALAINYLDSALSMSTDLSNWSQYDPDLDNIRECDRFKKIVDQNKEEIEAIILKNKELEGELNEDGSAKEPKEIQVVEVPFTAYGGVTKVNCSINNLPLSFIFDTGCSDVTISQVEATFMLKNGFLSKKDITGKEAYQTADGSIGIGTSICLKRIVFGGLELTDVRASVVDSQSAPLLLGQSVLQRLGKVEIDNENKVLRITTRP